MISHCGSQQINLFIAVGAVRRVEAGFSGLELYGFSNGLNRAVLRILGIIRYPLVPGSRISLNPFRNLLDHQHPFILLSRSD